VSRLSPEDQRELEGHVQVFLAEKSFEGCGGLEVTNERRVTIAAALYSAWAHALGPEYDELIRRIDAQKPTDIDPYGATNAAEFLEAFLERGARLKRKHPDLYEALQGFYKQDLAA
jgi:Mlc titration factor MtfA (ptsG expression regulator)